MLKQHQRVIKRVDIYAEISKNIRTVRKELHLTQRNIADLTGFSYEFIRRIEAKNCPNYFSIGTIYEISLALGIPLVDLVKVSFGENNDSMFNNDLSFFENCSTDFHFMISNISLELRKKDKDYQKVELENRIILNEYPNINNLLEEREIDCLNKKECDAMVRYLDNTLFLKNKEFVEIFLKGYKEAYFYFTRCNLLKDEIDKVDKEGNV